MAWLEGSENSGEQTGFKNQRWRAAVRSYNDVFPITPNGLVRASGAAVTDL